MLVQIENVLRAPELQQLRTELARAEFVDGAATAGSQARMVKRNLQLPSDSPVAVELGRLVATALQRNSVFAAAAFPRRSSTPLFSRYEAGMTYGNHVDNALLGRQRLRTDVAVTLFLSDPADYDGGELVIQDSYGVHAVKPPAGNMVVYPASSLHRVEPVTRGCRDAAVCWVESMIRDERQRRLLFDLDNSIRRLAAGDGDGQEIAPLTACYHNLLRMWAET